MSRRKHSSARPRAKRPADEDQTRAAPDNGRLSISDRAPLLERMANDPKAPSLSAHQLRGLQAARGNQYVERLIRTTLDLRQAAGSGLWTAQEPIKPLLWPSRTHSLPTGPHVLRQEAKAGPKPATWTGTEEQRAFLESVLNAHLALSKRLKGSALPDLGGAELANVPGTSVRMKKEAAAAAGGLLAAANGDLAAAKAAKVRDALRTVRITAFDGYRGRSTQETLWRRYFPKHYKGTASKRAKLSGGEHGDAAVRYMAGYVHGKVAAPGFSNHQAGIAIDFGQERTKSHAVLNSTDSKDVAAWRRTWFFKWLETNAADHNFEEYRVEPWHWIYRAPASEE